MVILKGRALDGVFSRLAAENCSDEFTDAGFAGFDAEINKHCIDRAIVALVIVIIVILYNVVVESLVHCDWLIKCKWAKCLFQVRINRAIQRRRQERVSHVRNPIMSNHHAPSLKTRKEMAKKTGKALLSILNTDRHQSVSQTNQMVPVLGIPHAKGHHPMLVGQPRVVQPIIQPVIIQQVNVPPPVIAQPVIGPNTTQMPAPAPGQG